MKGKRTKQTCLGRKHQRPREPAGNDGGGGSRLTAARLQVPPTQPHGAASGNVYCPRGARGGAAAGVTTKKRPTLRNLTAERGQKAGGSQRRYQVREEVPACFHVTYGCEDAKHV